MNFLVVDDSPTMRRIVINTLKRLGYRSIEEADNGQTALDKLKTTEGINFIVTDWNMPVMDGLTFVKTVRSSPEFADIPILIVTTRSVKDDIIEAMKSGVNNYVVKPFTPEIMKSKIETILSNL
ncbi:MAG: two-component system response regulator [Candidatus Cloacimonadota bacterium]|nr:MAG: two-component system response regulator [Candidatus Cloacimonadota bacterium]